MASTGCEKVLRDLHFDLDQLPDSFAQRVAVPSVGIDFGSYHIRVALIDNTPENKVSVCLATFSSADFETALQQAKKHLSKEDGVSVFYTGRATDSHVEAIKTSFPTAKEVSRRDKLDSHNAGAGFLIKSSLPNETLFHDLSEIEKKVASVPQNAEVMAAMFPPKMVQMMGMFFQEVAMSASKTFPFVLSIVGANNIICQVEENGSYKTADSCSTGGNSLNTIWNLIGHPGHTENFEHLMQLAKEGERRKIDGVTTEILDFVGFYAMMPRDFPVFTFGKMEKLKRDEVEPKDLARALAAYTSDMLLSRVTDITKVLRTFKTYYAGSLFQHEAIRNEMAERSFAWGGMGMIKPQFFKTDATAALGACIDTSAN